MPEWLVFVLLSLASFRVCRFFLVDKLAEPMMERLRWHFERRWQAKHDGGSEEDFNSKIAYLLSCYWCLGFWVSGVLTLVLWATIGIELPWIQWLAASAAVGLLGELDGD